MDSPGTSQVGSARSSVIDSIRGCTLAGLRIPKEELRKKITFPQYIRLAVREAIQAKDVESSAVSRLYDAAHAGGAEPEEPPEFPLVVFINSKSGGRHGPELKARLKELMADEQIFDLQVLKPHEFVQYGLYCLEKFASLEDGSAATIREKLRIVVAGGDGTVGWVLGCLGELNKQGRMPVPPTGIIPLGTGNDLSWSFNWGGSLPFNWKSTIKRTLDKIANGPIGHLDSWACFNFNASWEGFGHTLFPKTHKRNTWRMDAQVAYGFHHLRNEKPYLAQGPISNKKMAPNLVNLRSPSLTGPVSQSLLH